MRGRPSGTIGRVSPQQRVVASGVGSDDLATTEMLLNIGPQHPATHGVLRLLLTLDGERIVDAETMIGYMHRGAEKLFEVRDYRQILRTAAKDKKQWPGSQAQMRRYLTQQARQVLPRGKKRKRRR